METELDERTGLIVPVDKPTCPVCMTTMIPFPSHSQENPIEIVRLRWWCRKCEDELTNLTTQTEITPEMDRDTIKALYYHNRSISYEELINKLNQTENSIKLLQMTTKDDIEAVVAKLREKTNTCELNWYTCLKPGYYTAEYLGVEVRIRKYGWLAILPPTYELCINGHSACQSSDLLRPLYDDIVGIVKNTNVQYKAHLKKVEEDEVRAGVKTILEG